MNSRRLVNDFLRDMIRHHRHEAGLTVEELAERSSIPRGTLSCLLGGHCWLTPAQVLKLQLALGLPHSELWPRLVECERVTDAVLESIVLKARSRLPRQLSLGEVVQAVCEEFGVTVEELASKSRERRLSRPRAVATRIVEQEPDLTLVSLSRLLDRHYVTLYRIAQWADLDPEFAGQVRQVELRLHGQN